MHEQTIAVHFRPSKVAESELAGSTVVVIDLLRASTTICCALAAGASEVVPFRTIEETLAAAEKAGRSKVVLGGERGGKRISGFDLGNSPSEYTSTVIGGRPVYITTTNGTQALYHARRAKRVIIGAVVNLSAVVASLNDEPRIDLLCAGTNGQETLEDILAVGAIVHSIQQKSGDHVKVNEAAQDSSDEWSLLAFFAEREQRTLTEQLAIELRETQGGRNLLAIGLDADLAACAQVDKLQIAPELDVANWRITVT
jgi:2-phosphosulfolactate phosphatase